MNTSKFLTPFDATLLNERTRQGRRLWRLNRPLVYWSESLGIVIAMPIGFITDLNSTPRLPVIYLLVGDLADEATAMHDYVYSLALFPRAVCDGLMREAAIATGTPAWQANIMWAGVRVGGHDHYGSQYTI